MTLFAKIEDRFLPIPEDKLILTEPFLKACNTGVLPLIDCLGATFVLVRSDVAGNISKLEKKFNIDKEKFVTINAMLEEEIETDSSDLARVGCLWLTRGLSFICALLEIMVEQYKNGEVDDNLGLLTRQAYDKTLKQYHGWFTKKMFGGLSRALPTRKQFLKSLNVEDSSESQLMTEMEEFWDLLSSNTDVLSQCLKKLNLDTPGETQ